MSFYWSFSCCYVLLVFRSVTAFSRRFLARLTLHVLLVQISIGLPVVCRESRLHRLSPRFLCLPHGPIRLPTS
ncbi:uncharacterized protein F5147DRAFT_694075 [Suillus discolor]|uniref:Uncharacterized protein n=1 Tax=Suillus discolor TaxID=1912936 RepID=A0A9P7JTW7_9AGAM|nr:uncharacterized protein F5147DRAFT_694075 [Suillus discolor]KAG2108633.1 hypothetical protein F5147DRAFT_694075 [Suillus discolor]